MNLELLVKLASIGTAGVSIFAIFMIGNAILKLPNDVPAWKPILMKKYMNMCVITAVICAVSGGVNAYFNQTKIADANKKVARMSDEYTKQVRKLEEGKNSIFSNFAALKNVLDANNAQEASILASINMAEMEIKEIKMIPVEEMLKDYKKRKIEPEKLLASPVRE